MNHASLVGELSSVSNHLNDGNASLDAIRARVDALRDRMPSLSPERGVHTVDAPPTDLEAENRLLKDLLRASVLHNRLLSTENKSLREIVDSFLSAE